MPRLLIAHALAGLVLALLLLSCARALQPSDPAAALAVFGARRAVLDVALYALPLALLAWGVWEAGHSGRPAAWRLGGPLALFVLASGAAWFGVDEAAFAFARAHGLWQGGFSAGLIYALLFWPGALGAVVVAHGIVSFWRRRRAA